MEHTSGVLTGESAVISTEDKVFFEREGYLIFQSFLTPEHSERVMRDIDRLKVARTGGYPKRNSETNGSALVITFPDLGGLTSHPPMVDNVRLLMDGDGFAFHHQHAECHQEGTPSSNWHHDYEQFPQTDRDQLMVHCFYYPNGLNGEAGDLLLLPGSHRSVMHKNAFSASFYTRDLPGSLTVDDLPQGSVAMVHSALLHARRAKPGGADHPRYFTDVSYCQKGPQKWPAYGFPLPKMWLHKQVCERALKAGHGRGGEYNFLYTTSLFYDPDSATEEQRVDMERSLRQRQIDRGARERTEVS